MPTKTPSKSAKKSKATPARRKAATPLAGKPGSGKATARPNSPRRPAPAAAPRGTASRRAQARSVPARPIYVPRALPIPDDDDDVLMAHGAGGGVGYGRCGGRMLGSTLEQTICDRLGQAGVAHSHAPRHFEVALQEKQVAAYAPMIVLRGRGREGKSVVVEAAESLKNPILPKIVAFRRQYGQEYYVIFVAPDDVLDEVALATYDEACAETDVNTLISRLAE
jgi:hypothetical protein